MACAPTRVGSDAALQLSVAQGDQLSKHCKMKQSLFRSSLWHKSCKGQPHVWHVRNMVSQAVAIEEMESSEFKTMRWQRWQAHETMALIAATKQHAESTEAAEIEKKKVREKWKEIEAFCQEKGIERSAEQCRTRWIRLTSAYTQIRSWEEKKTPEQLSFWSMELDEKKNKGLLLFLDQKTYEALDELLNKAADDMKNALVEADGEAHKGDDKDNQLPVGLKNDGKVQAEFLSACKPNCEEGSEMYVRDANAKLSSEEHDDQVEVDESIKAQLPHASAEKMDCNHKELHESQHAESLKVLGTAEHTKPMFYSDEKDMNNYNIAQLFHASKEMDGSNKDQCKGYLEEHGIEEHINVMPRDDNNHQFSPITHDRIMPAAREGMEQQSEGVDGSSLTYHETNLSHTDSLKAGGIVHANDFSASVEKHECQETVSRLLFIGVDVLDENLSGQVAGIAGSCMSMDEQGCKNLSEERNLAKEACIDKNKKGKGFFEVCKDNSPPCHTNAEDISNALVNETQSNCMEAQGNNGVNQKVEDMVAQLEEHINVMPRDDIYRQFSPRTHDRTMPAAREGMEEQSEDVDGSSLAYHETSFCYTDSLKAGGFVHANDFSASEEEKHECQETVSPLSFIGVDVLDENLSRQVAVTAGSCMSMDEQGCKNLSEDRNLAKEACIDKNEKGEGFFKVCKDNSPPCHNNAEDISNAWVNETQSNCMEAQGNNDVSRKVEDMVAQINNFVPIVGEAYNRDLHSSPEQQQLGSNPVMDSKEETGTDGVFEHGREDDNTFPCICSEISESTSSTGKTSGDVQDGHFQKNQSQPSREDHVKTNAGIGAGIASASEHSTGHGFKEKRGGELQNGSADYNGKTTKHTQNIEHFEGVKDGDSLVKTELCGQSQLVNGTEGSDATARMKVAVKEGVYLTEMMETRGTTMDAGTSALSSLEHQFHHASSNFEHKGLIKGEDGSSGKVCEVKRAESSETAAAELEFVIKDGRGSHVTSGKGTTEDQSQKSNNSSKFDKDVFLYIPAAIVSLVRSVLQSIRNFFKF